MRVTHLGAVEYHIGDPPPRKNPRKLYPEREEWYGYRWPATRLTDEHRRMLCIMSNETKKPMTQLLAESVELMYELFRNEQ